MQGPKTHEQQLRMFEKKPDVPDRRQAEITQERAQDNSHSPPRPSARESEFPVRRVPERTKRAITTSTMIRASDVTSRSSRQISRKSKAGEQAMANASKK